MLTIREGHGISHQCATSRHGRSFNSRGVVGRVLLIIEIESSDISEEQWKFHAQVVPLGNQKVFEEISNAPADITAARCALAVGFLNGVNATYRDCRSRTPASEMRQ